MALKFDDFSHYSKYDGDLPGYDISGGEEVFDYWRSPYDPNLTYLHNVSTSNDYWNSGTYGYGYYFASNTIGGGQGIRYPRFIHDGYWNEVSITRESGYPNLSGGARSAIVNTFGYLPAKTYTTGYGYAWYDDWQHIFSSLPGYTAFTNIHQWPIKKKIKHGRLYFQYQGGNYNDPFSFDDGLNPTNGRWEATLFSSTHNAGDPVTNADALLMDFINDPVIRVFDARYLPGTNESILRENESYDIEPSPIVGQNSKGGTVGGALTTYGLNVIPYSLPSTTGTISWGPQRQYSQVGHALFWGRNFAVGNGMMVFATARHTCEMWGINGEKTPLVHKPAGINIDDIYPAHGGMYFRPETENGQIEYDDYIAPGMYDPIILKHDRMAFWTRTHGESIFYTRMPDGPSHLYIFDSNTSRIRMRVGNDNWEESQQTYAIGNGRLYTIAFHGATYDNGPGYSNDHEGAVPYWYSTTYLRSHYSASIFTLSGVPIKKSWAPNGGTLMNLASGEQASYTPQLRVPNPVKSGFADRIVAGCGRVVFADSRYYHTGDNNYGYTNETGKAWLYTQDGDFIKSLSFKDEGWGILYGAIGKSIRFGYKIEIANNLIFVLAPDFDLSDWITTSSGGQTWGGKGRIYIYSLDGELLAAFSGFNLGFSASFPFNFDDFCTDGVDLFLFNNQDNYNGENMTDFGKQGQGKIWNNGSAYYSAEVGSHNNAGGTRIYARSHRVGILHLKLPETISNYYDKIAETYRY